MSSPSVATPPVETRSAFSWPVVAWFGGLLLLCYWPVLQRLASDWMIDEDMGHGMLVPPVALFIVWQRRDQILARACSPNWWGLLIVLLGALQLLVATLGVEYFLARAAFIVSLAGVVITVGGLPLLRQLAFPLFLLVFMIPLPAIIYNQITFPLQLLASRIAEVLLGVVGIPVLRDGNILELPSQRLSVVEACSGIRSLFSLSFLALVYAYFFDSKTWMRAALLVLTVPIAILVNALRVTLTGVLSEYDPELAKGAFHTAEGWIVFVLALALLVAVHKFLTLAHAKVARHG